ncbi:inactive ubiquitin carboxyl-terminal hydrolase 54 [Austrofundulus limnaeus]|uniref:Inactive ubiquitin carboxyl-terminal hydrolase 54 n=1 Tax=Austrofundulus limnaeus TaxID=52670 RepID=A0A2I4DC34_AUSLI|nr:PREDICTED: inactive ubiquitin carboxyl-terminal hydrolase 54-like [Austrofundulus limnaeus]
MTNIIRPLSSSSSSSLPAAILSSELSSSSSCGQHLPATNSAVSSLSSVKPQDWEADSTSGESKSSSLGGAVTGRYRPAWRPRRETLNIDTIFTRERRRQAGYSPLGGPPSEDCGAPGSEAADPSFTVQEEGMSVRPGSSKTLPSSFRGAEFPPPPPPRLIQRMESGYESSERNSSSPVSLDLNLGDRECVVKKTLSSSSSSGPSWRNIRSKSSGSLLQEVNSSSRGGPGTKPPSAGRSELDELQEEVLKRAREEEQQRRQEKEKEAALGFNPRPSKYLDLDQLQIQGKSDSFDRCVSEAELLLDQSLRLEQAGEVAAALSAVNEAVSKLQSVVAEGGASSHSRLQRCMRRARSLQQRMQLQQQKQRCDSEAEKQQPEQQHEEEQKLQEQPSEKPFRVLLTDAQGNHSPATQDPQALPPSTCLVKPLPPKLTLVSEPPSSPLASPSGEDRRNRSPCSRLLKPLCTSKSLPVLCGETSLEDLAPPPLTEEERSVQSQATPTIRSQSRTPSSVSTSRCHVITEVDSYSTRQPKATPSESSPAQRLVPPPSSLPTRKWSCLNLDQSDVVDSLNPSISSPFYSPPDSPYSAPPVTQPSQTSSLPPNGDYRSALPVERWAENVNRYYGSQNAAGGGGGCGEPVGELSELETLYQASLLAPSMHRGTRGVSPQPAGSRPGVRRVPSGSGRSKTPTAEIERFAYRTPVTPVQKPPLAEDESYSAENLRRLARSLSGSVIGLRPQNPPRSCDPSLSRPPSRHPDLHSSSSLPPRHHSTSSSSSSSFTADHSFHQPRHHGPPAPLHPHLQPPRPPSSGPSSWGHSGPPRPPQQHFLVVSDRSPAASGLHSVALNYGTLPRAPPRHALPPSSTSSLPRPRTGPGPGPPPLPAPQNLYATLGPPRRSTNTSSTNRHHSDGGLPGRVNGSSAYAPQPLRGSGEPAKPLRLDVPPETDWRLESDVRTGQFSSARRQQPLQRTDRGPYRAPQLCSLCLQTPVEPSCPYCLSCRAHVARFHLHST